MLRWFPSSKLLLHASHAALPILKSSKLPPVVDAADLIVSKLSIKQSEIQNSAVSETTPYHHNVFTFTLFLPEGRTGVAWELANKMMLFLPPQKIVSLTSPLDLLLESTLHLSFPSLSLSLFGFRGLQMCTVFLTVWVSLLAGAFLIPFTIMLVIAGLPLMFMELAFGQYANLGPVAIYKKFCPLFQGLGYGMVIVSAIVMLYYNLIIAWTLFYMFASFNSVLPWQNCEAWSTVRK
jgi:hypothetical protein